MATPKIVDLPSGKVVELANPGMRFLARLVDLALLFVISFVVNSLANVITQEDWMDLSYFDSTSFDLINLFMSGLFLLYYAIGIGLYGRTIGKRICQVTIVKLEDGSIPGIRAGILREIVPTALPLLYLPGQLLVLLGYLWLVWDQNRQTLFDKMVKTIGTHP